MSADRIWVESRRHPAPMSIHQVFQPQPLPVILTRRGKRVLAASGTLVLLAVGVLVWVMPVYVLVRR